jgi:membrane-associated phospholipid phosphatase
VSRWLYPFERRLLWRRRLLWWGGIALVFVVLLLLDRAAFHFLFVGADPELGEGRLHRIEGKDWYKAFRTVGTLWPWIFLCAGLALHGFSLRRAQLARAADSLISGAILILTAAVASGLLAEILQVLTGRLRPKDTGGEHIFRGLIDRLSNSDGVGFPSSHAAVAFGAAFMIYFLWPGAGFAALIAAALCGLTRLLSGAHFVTDIFAAAVLGYAMGRILRPGSWHGLRRGLLLP